MVCFVESVCVHICSVWFYFGFPNPSIWQENGVSIYNVLQEAFFTGRDGIICNSCSRHFHANESPMNKTNTLHTHCHPSHPFPYSYLQLSFHHKSSSYKSPYPNLRTHWTHHLTHHLQLILYPLSELFHPRLEQPRLERHRQRHFRP